MPAGQIVLPFVVLFILKYGLMLLKYVLLRPKRAIRNWLLRSVFTDDGTIYRGGVRTLSYWHCGVPMWKIKRYKPDPTANISPEGSRRLNDVRICTRCRFACEHPTLPRLQRAGYWGLVLLAIFSIGVGVVLEFLWKILVLLKRAASAVGLSRILNETVIIWMIYGAAFGIAVGVGESYGTTLSGTVMGGVLGFLLTLAIPVIYILWELYVKREPRDPTMGMCIALGTGLATLLGIFAALCSYVGRLNGIGIPALAVLIIPLAARLRMPIRASASACVTALVTSLPFLWHSLGIDSLLVLEVGSYAVVIVAGLVHLIRTFFRIGTGQPLRQAIQ